MKWRTPPQAEKYSINYSFFDRFTFVHFLIGVFYGMLNLSFVTAFVLSFFWEFIENPLKAYFPQLFPHATSDTLKNSLGDTLAVCSGWGLVFFFF
jgi:hypothetical protein